MTKQYSFLLFFILLWQIACTQSTEHARTIAVSDYLKALTETKNEILIDVRTPGEFAQEHLNNAMNIDFQGNDFEKRIETLDRNKPIFVYCLSGGRSAEAMNVFVKKGFKNVTNMKGGIMQWKALNYPLNTTDLNAKTNTWKGMTEADFDKIINGDIPVLIDFNAVWCGPCKMLKPILDDIQTEYAGKIKVVPIDIDDNKSLADKMKIRQIPFMIYYKKGKVMMNIEGYSDKEIIVKSLKLKK